MKTETIVFYDVPGEVFRFRAEDSQYGADVKEFAPFVEKADGIIFLIDPSQIDTFQAVKPVTDEEEREGLDTVLSAISNIIKKGDSDRLCPTPIAVCIPKMDDETIGSALPPELWSRLQEDIVTAEIGDDGLPAPVFNAVQYNPISEGLYRFLTSVTTSKINAFVNKVHSSFSHYNFFAFTALGCGVDIRTNESGESLPYPVGPLLSPKRIAEPVLWLFNQFGYIDENMPIFDPASRRKCKHCGRVGFVQELPPHARERVIKKGWIHKETLHVDFQCRACGCEFPK